MSSTHEDIARALVQERVASARRGQLVRQVKSGRRDARRANRWGLPGRWRTRLLRRRPVAETPSTVTTMLHGPIPLESILERIAELIVGRGTRTEMATLCAMSAATGHLSPGAAAALVDWDGSEAARLRAFGVVHGVVLRDLDAQDRSRLLARLTGTARPVTSVEGPRVDSANRETDGPPDESRSEAA